MSSFLCFICHSTINSYTRDEVREKYKDVVGMHLCPDSQLCYICCYMLHKLWLFKSICLKRSLEYPVLFSEKGTLNLHRSEIEMQTICSKESCNPYQNRNINSKSYHFSNEDSYNIYENNETDTKINYGLFDNESEFKEYIHHSENIDNSTQYNDHDHYMNDSVEHNDSVNDDDLFQYDNQMSKSVDDDLENDNSHIDYNETVHNDEEHEYLNDTEINDTNIDPNKTVNEEVDENVTKENDEEKKKKKSKKKKKKDFEILVQTVEEQKIELDKKRKSKKYLESQFKCYNCALGFLFKDTYQTHMMRHEESNGEYRCDICTLRFASPAVLRSHVKLHKFKYLCRLCDKVVTSRGHFSRCPMSCTEVTCHLCGRLFQNSNGLQQHLKRFHHKNNGRTYSCNVCGKTYNNQGAVRTHMIKHVNRTFQCDICDSTFTSPYGLNRHKKKHEEPQTNSHYCATCDVSFNTKKSLMAHLRNTINHQQTIFECPICNKMCPNEKSLASHIERVHSTTKNYACMLCPATYSNRKSLVRHIGSHNKKPEAKLAVCHLCGSSFKGNTKLKRHLKEVCEKDKLEEELSSYYSQNAHLNDADPMLN